MTGLFKNLSIRSRFVLPIAGMAIAFAAFIMLFFPARQRAVDEKGLENKALSVARMIGYSVAAGLEFEDRESVLQVLNWAKNDPDILYIIVRNGEGGDFASYGVEGQRPGAMPSAVPLDFQASQSGEVLEIVGPVRRGEAVAGSLQLGVSTRSIVLNYRRGLWTSLVFILAVAVLAFVAMQFVGKQITTPILSLTQAAEQIASDDMKRLADETRIMASGDLTREVQVEPRRIAVETGGEIGRMASAFNLMLDKL
jgi:hypothetical protein